MRSSILIVGASIAGLTAAHWLARSGFTVTIAERSPGMRSGGNGVDLRGRAAEVIAGMGLAEQVRAAATDVIGMRFVDASDRVTAQVDTRMAGAVEIMRGDLVRLLASATAGVEVRFARGVTALTQEADSVTVTFDGGASERYDLVIGADGVHSAVRRLAFGPDERSTRFRGHYFAFADAGPDLGEPRWMTAFNQPGRMVGIYRAGRQAESKAYFVFRSAPLRYDRRDIAEQARIVRAAFAADADRRTWRVRELLDAAAADPFLYFDAVSQVRLTRWSTGRVVLIGDAAYCASPASGAGAELAVAGAHRLATELAAADGDHRAAFARYQATLEPFVRRRQRIGANLRMMVPRTEAGRRLRDGFTRLPFLTSLERRYDAA
ncbi:FAD-dependent monooxygenase [Microbacterium sp. NEAU-LLC]|uniref:FAD-dependent monooxygenase n=1 Tax=Microbacterium helvum TaxID=2773713 RepID=A0ABR8NSR1_9MICO|nr:FAD-dependent monooxygenase [Microbacterium helvum]MBD3943613.1 FAD-dependent monooxygenase [Microbacterium helvum]